MRHGGAAARELAEGAVRGLVCLQAALGGSEQLVERVAVFVEAGVADRHVEREALGARHRRVVAGHAGLDADGDLADHLGRRVAQERDEAVAALAHEHVLAPELRANLVRHLLQQQPAAAVAERVADAAEVVQVHRQDRESVLVARGARALLLEEGAQVARVRQARQLVGEAALARLGQKHRAVQRVGGEARHLPERAQVVVRVAFERARVERERAEHAPLAHERVDGERAVAFEVVTQRREVERRVGVGELLVVGDDPAGDALALPHAAPAEGLAVRPGGVLDARGAARVVTEVDGAGVERHQLFELRGDDRERLADGEAAVEALRQLVERDDLVARLVRGEDGLEVLGGLPGAVRDFGALLGEAGGGRGLADGLGLLDGERRESLLPLLHLGDLGLEGRQVLDEELDHLRVVEGAAVLLQEVDGLLARHRAAVLAVFAHGVEAIDDREHARRERYLLALQAVRVAGAVPALVVVADDGHERVRELDAFEYLRADHRVQLHPVELGGGELARLVQDVVGNGDLADVVQERPGVQRLALLVREAEQAGHALGVNLHALHVLVRDLVFGIDGGGEGFERAHVQGARLFDVRARGLDVLEVGAVGEVVGKEHRDGEADGGEAVVVDHRVDDRRRQHAREVGDEDPRVALAPHAEHRLVRLERDERDDQPVVDDGLHPGEHAERERVEEEGLAAVREQPHVAEVERDDPAGDEERAADQPDVGAEVEPAPREARRLAGGRGGGHQHGGVGAAEQHGQEDDRVRGRDDAAVAGYLRGRNPARDHGEQRQHDEPRVERRAREPPQRDAQHARAARDEKDPEGQQEPAAFPIVHL